MTGESFRMGDERPLEDILRRDNNRWLPMIPIPENWDIFCRDFTALYPVSTTQRQLESRLKLLLQTLQELFEPQQDQHLLMIEHMATHDFPWELNVALVCYSLAITGRSRKISTIWEVDTKQLALLARRSPMFRDSIEESIFSAMIERRVEQLRDFFQGPKQVDRLGVIDRSLAGSKRPSQEELRSPKRFKPDTHSSGFM